jgi:hypothetical protein
MKSHLAALFLGISFLHGAPLEVSDLRVEHQVSPSGVGTKPRLSWKLVSKERGKRQTAYEILAATTPDKLTDESADLWKSGKQNLGIKHLVPWNGKSLRGVRKVHWKVRVSDEKGVASPWSKPAVFRVRGKSKLPSLRRISTFESSSTELNALYHESVGTLEKRLTSFAGGEVSALGEGDQVHRSARAMLYHFEAVPHLTRWLRLMDQSRTKDLTFTTAPKSKKVASMVSEGAIIAHHPVWWMGGDDAYPKERWPLYEKHMIFRESRDQAFKGTKWGETAPAEGMSAEFLDLVYLGFTTRLIRELALPAQQPMNAIRFQDYAARIKKSFGKRYLKADGSLSSASQSAHVTALRSAVLEKEQQSKIIEALMASLSKDGVQVGPIGAHFLPGVLTLTGHQEAAVKLLQTLAPEQRKSFVGNGVSEWLMSYLAGIDTSLPGFQQIRITPKIPDDDSLSWVKASYDSPSGKVSVHWQKLEKGGLQVEFTIPAGTIGQVSLPSKKGATITESGSQIGEAVGIKVVKQDDQMIGLITQSGSYSITIR